MIDYNANRDDVSPWYLVKQWDGGFWVSPEEPTDGKWEKFNTWGEAYAAGWRHRTERGESPVVKGIAKCISAWMK